MAAALLICRARLVRCMRFTAAVWDLINIPLPLVPVPLQRNGSAVVWLRQFTSEIIKEARNGALLCCRALTSSGRDAQREHGG